MSRPSSSASTDELGRVSSSAGVALPGRLIGRVCQVATTIFLARHLGPGAFGLFAVAWTLFRIVSIVGPLGFDQAVLRFGAAHIEKEPAELRGVLVQSLGIAVGAGAVFGLGVVALAPWLATGVFDDARLTPLLRCVGLACPFVPLLRVAASATRLTGTVRYSILSEDLGQPILFLAISIALLSVGLTPLGATAGAGAAFAASALLAVAFVRTLGRGARPRWMSTEALLSFAVPAAMTTICAALIHVADRFCLGALRTPEEVGLYQAASQPAIGFSLIASAINVGFAAIVPRLAHENRHAELERVFKVSTRWAVFMAIPPLVVIVAMPNDVMHIVFGASYGNAAAPLLILAVAHVLNAINGQTTYLLMLAGHQQPWMRVSIALFAIDVVLVAVLVSWLGAAGAALATLVTMALMLVAGTTMSAHYMKMIVFGRAWLKGLAAGALSWVAVETVVRLIPHPSAARLGVAALVALASFALAIFLLRIDQDDRGMLRSLVGLKPR